jgi:hypothetical protein
MQQRTATERLKRFSKRGFHPSAFPSRKHNDRKALEFHGKSHLGIFFIKVLLHDNFLYNLKGKQDLKLSTSGFSGRSKVSFANAEFRRIVANHPIPVNPVGAIERALELWGYSLKTLDGDEFSCHVDTAVVL